MDPPEVVPSPPSPNRINSDSNANQDATNRNRAGNVETPGSKGIGELSAKEAENSENSSSSSRGGGCQGCRRQQVFGQSTLLPRRAQSCNDTSLFQNSSGSFTGKHAQICTCHSDCNQCSLGSMPPLQCQPDPVTVPLGEEVMACSRPSGYAESNESSVCRICHDNPSKLDLMSPCLCKGSMGRVHRECLERWLGESGKSVCEICGYQYVTIRRPKVGGVSGLGFDIPQRQMISAWLCVVGAQHYSFGGGEGVEAPPSKYSYVETPPRAIPPSFVQPVESYHEFEPPPSNPRAGNSEISDRSQLRMQRLKAVESPNSTWTSIGLLTLTGTLLAAYYIWLFVAIRYHIQVWRDWQLRNFLITIVPVDPVEGHVTDSSRTSSEGPEEDSSNNNSSAVIRDPPKSVSKASKSSGSGQTSKGSETKVNKSKVDLLRSSLTSLSSRNKVGPSEFTALTIPGDLQPSELNRNGSPETRTEVTE